MKRGFGVLSIATLLLSLAAPAEARREPRGRTTSGSTRYVDSPPRVRVRYRDDDQDSAEREYRYERHRDASSRRQRRRSPREGQNRYHIGVGFAIGSSFGVFDASLNPFSSVHAARAIDPGLLLSTTLDQRVWLVVDQLRAGLGGQIGASYLLGDWRPHADDAFEEGSNAQFGRSFSLYALCAYQPQLSDTIQLWFGGRLGLQTFSFHVATRGWRYAQMARDFVSLGPELGVRFSEGYLGLTIWAFADLTQPGSAQLIASFTFEAPKATGQAF